MNEPGAPEKQLTMASGGWWLLIAGLFAILTTVWVLWFMTQGRSWSEGNPPTPAVSNGFDLRESTVPIQLIHLRCRRDWLRSPSAPEIYSPNAISQLNEGKKPYLVSGDPVVGLELGGEIRAYPLRILRWHDVINDELGGVPIAVTHCPYSGSVAVYDRRVAGRPDPVEFGVSGLMYQSNQLIYTRKSDTNQEVESCWSQFTGEAVVGPAAHRGEVLTPIPFVYASWDQWLKSHPASTSMAYDDTMKKYYKKGNVYGEWQRGRKVQFPVEPLPDLSAGAPHPKEPMIYVRFGDRSRRFALTEMLEALGEKEELADRYLVWETSVGDVPVTLHYNMTRQLREQIWVTFEKSGSQPDEIHFAFRYVMDAFRPEAESN